MSTILSTFAALTPPDEVRASGASCPEFRVNSHIHLPPNFSAFESVSEAVGLAAAQRVTVLGVSNYYDFTVYADFLRRAQAVGVYPLLGLEIVVRDEALAAAGVKINDPGNPGKMYLCGKGITRVFGMTPEARRLMDLIRAKDSARMARMVERLAELLAERGFPTGVDEADVVDMVVRRHGVAPETVTLQERHVAQAFQEALFRHVPEGRRAEGLTQALHASLKAPDDPVAVQGEIRSHLMKAGKPAFVEETFVTFDEAKTLILELGGIPCYPTLADGASPLCAFETPVSALIERLKERGLHAVEFIPVRNAPDVLVEYVTAVRAAGVVVTAGTEHNTLDKLPMAPTGLNGTPIPPAVAKIFREGACVMAAHQFRTLNGETGFVDAQGRPNPAYASDEERISAFAAEGAAVLETYWKKTG